MPDDAIERARDVEERTMICVNDIHALATQLATGSIMPAMFRRKTFARLLAFASQQAPEGWAIALHLSKQEEGACITSIVLSVHNGTSEADALKRAIDYAAVEKPGFAVEQYLAQKYPPAMLDAAPSVVEGV